MRVKGILETALYVADPAATAAFYRRVFGSPSYWSPTGWSHSTLRGGMCSSCSARAQRVSRSTPAAGRSPPTRASPTHFSVSAEDVEPWKAKLEAEGVEVESEVAWPRGARSVYFRDPDGNLAELISPGFWAIY